MSCGIIKYWIRSFLAIFLFSFLIGCEEEHQIDTVLLVGTASDYPPFEFQYKGEFSGFDIELVKAFAKNSGKECKIIDIDFAGLIASLNSHKVDMIISTMNPTEKRRKAVDFSDIYYNGKPTLLVRNHSNIKDFESLENKILGVQLGSVWEGLAVEKSKSMPLLKIHSLNKVTLLVEDLKLKRIDAMITEHEQAVDFCKVNIGLTHSSLEWEGVGYAAAFRKNSPLVQEFNNFLKHFVKSGELKALQKKWFK